MIISIVVLIGLQENRQYWESSIATRNHISSLPLTFTLFKNRNNVVIELKSSPITLLIYNPKHIRKSTLVNDIPLKHKIK